MDTEQVFQWALGECQREQHKLESRIAFMESMLGVQRTGKPLSALSIRHYTRHSGNGALLTA